MAEEKNHKVEELQALESHLQGFLMQKQGLQIEMNQVDNALEELKKAGDEVYRVVSGIMIKSDKEKLGKELEEKKAVFDGKIKAMEKQEALLEKQALELRSELAKENKSP